MVYQERISGLKKWWVDEQGKITIPIGGRVRFISTNTGNDLVECQEVIAGNACAGCYFSDKAMCKKLRCVAAERNEWVTFIKIEEDGKRD